MKVLKTTNEKQITAIRSNKGLFYPYSSLFGSENVIPHGWRVPTISDWNTLANFVSNDPNTHIIGDTFRKLISTSDWFINEGMDFYGMNIKPSGKYILDGTNTFGDITVSTYLWVYQTNPLITSGIPFRYGYPNDPYLGTDIYFANKGYLPVRLIKEDSINPGTITDYENNIYDTITIGNQVWTASNLASKKTNLGNNLIVSYTDADAAANVNSLSCIECVFNSNNTFKNILVTKKNSKLIIIP